MRFLLLALLLVAAPVACADDPVSSGNAPADHTINRSGIPHRPGLDDPQTQCVSCHGADLRGGDSGEPGCYDCHGRTW